MATRDATLAKGLTVGGKLYRNAVLRDPSAWDVIQATADAEKVVMVPVGLDDKGQPVLQPKLVTSPTMVGVNVLRRQIVNIGPFTEPIGEELFSLLSPEDFNILQREADLLEKASLEVAQRGRSDSAGAGSAPSD